MSTDPKVNTTAPKSGRANLQLNSLQLIAANKESDTFSADTPAGRAEKEAELPIITTKDFTQAEPGLPNQTQM